MWRLAILADRGAAGSSGAFRAGTDRRLHDHVVPAAGGAARGQIDGGSADDELGRHDGHAGGLQIEQVALVAVPADGVCVVDQSRDARPSTPASRTTPPAGGGSPTSTGSRCAATTLQSTRSRSTPPCGRRAGGDERIDQQSIVGRAVGHRRVRGDRDVEQAIHEAAACRAVQPTMRAINDRPSALRRFVTSGPCHAAHATERRRRTQLPAAGRCEPSQRVPNPARAARLGSGVR